MTSASQPTADVYDAVAAVLADEGYRAYVLRNSPSDAVIEVVADSGRAVHAARTDDAVAGGSWATWTYASAVTAQPLTVDDDFDYSAWLDSAVVETADATPAAVAAALRPLLAA